MEFYIFVTKGCNLNCKYCFEANSEKSSKNELKKLDVKKTANFILNHLDKKRNNVVFYGGEPLLNQKWIEEFVELMKNKNLTFTLQTNGMLLDKIDDFILENLDFIHISIDGNKQITDKFRGNGTYDVVLSNIRKIKPKFKGKIVARMTLVPENSIFNSVTHIINLKLFDYVYWQLENSPCRVEEKVKEDYKQDIQKLADFWIKNLNSGNVLEIIPFQSVTSSILNKKQQKHYRCGAGKFLVVIDSDGSCYSCDELIKPQFRIGSIDGDIELKPLSSKNSDFCSDCDINRICGGRCFKTSLFTVEKFRFYCDMTRVLVKEIQDKIPEIKTLIQKNRISMNDLELDCFTEEIP